jgi:hypothetical protein
VKPTHLTRDDEANGPIPKWVQRVCHDALDFIQVPAFPSAIRPFALTHFRRIVIQRQRWLSSVLLGVCALLLP